jgi:hypothetical protein
VLLFNRPEEDYFVTSLDNNSFMDSTIVLEALLEAIV